MDETISSLFEVSTLNRVAEVFLVAGDALLTYDDSAEVRRLADEHAFFPHRLAMKNTHHVAMTELAITNTPLSNRLPVGAVPEALLCEERPMRHRRRGLHTSTHEPGIGTG